MKAETEAKGRQVLPSLAQNSLTSLVVFFPWVGSYKGFANSHKQKLPFHDDNFQIKTDAALPTEI